MYHVPEVLKIWNGYFLSSHLLIFFFFFFWKWILNPVQENSSFTIFLVLQYSMYSQFAPRSFSLYWISYGFNPFQKKKTPLKAVLV